MELICLLFSAAVGLFIVGYFQDDSGEQNTASGQFRENQSNPARASSRSRNIEIETSRNNRCAQCGKRGISENKYCSDCQYEPLLDDGWDHFEQERYEEARDNAKEALQTPSSSGGALCLYASAESELGNWRGAAVHFEKALREGVEQPGPVYAALARAYGVIGDNKEAIRAATKSLEYDRDYRAYIQRGYAKLAYGNVEDASSDFRKASELDPENPHPWMALAGLAYRKDDLILLEECIDKLAYRCEQSVVKRFEVSLQTMKGNWEEAVKLGGNLIEDCAENEVFAEAFLSACIEVAPEVGADAVSTFDEYHFEDGFYQFISGALFLDVGREQDALSRVSTVREMADGELDGEDAGQFFLYLDVLEVTAEYMEDKSSLKNDEVEKLLERTEESDEQLFHICRCTLSALKGMIEQSHGNLEAALEWLHRSEGTEKLISAKLTEEVREAIREIHRDMAEIDLENETGEVPVYELLRKTNEILTETHCLPGYERRVQLMIDHFDDPPLVSVMGEYSVGKSTFINALLGAELLPTGEGVTTGTVVWLRYAEDERARVVYHDGHVLERNTLGAVDALVREDEEGQTARDIRHVELFLDTPILRRINIVDTPGLNAPFPEHAETTEEFLEKSDAILFLFNVEAAGKANEGEFLEKVKSHRRKALAIVNQIDLVPSHEIDDVLDFIRADFDDLFLDVLGVSGQLALEAALENDENKRSRSRMDELEEHMEKNLLDDARRIKKESLETKFLELMEQLEERRRQFETDLEMKLDGVESFSSEGKRWLQADMNEIVDEQIDELASKVDVTFEELAAELARASEGRGELPSRATIQSAEQELKQKLRAHWEELRQSFVAACEEFIEELLDKLDLVITDSDLRTVDEQAKQMRLRLETWKKEVNVHFEKVDCYLKGFLETNGLARVVCNTEDRRYDNPKSIAKVLRDQLDFAKTRPARELREWAQRTSTRFDEEVYALKTAIREAASRELNEVYRPVLQLEDLVEGNDQQYLQDDDGAAEGLEVEELDEPANLSRPKKLNPTQ